MEDLINGLEYLQRQWSLDQNTIDAAKKMTDFIIESKQFETISIYTLGITSLWIAIKFNETRRMLASTILNVLDGYVNNTEFVKTEKDILKLLRWNVFKFFK